MVSLEISEGFNSELWNALRISEQSLDQVDALPDSTLEQKLYAFLNM
jgi:hypothetical protein